MTYTYDLNTNGVLIIRCDATEQSLIRQVQETAKCGRDAEFDALESLLCNSDLEWIDPSETGDLTDAPILGIRDENGAVLARWGYMDYQVRSFLDDLIQDGKAVFVS
jgi:hypothetical protein